MVIDADLGISGRTASAWAGFREVVGRVCVGEVGAIFGLEVSRLARSSADLQRLLELCSLSDTLIIDSDGIYDLTQFNDRLLLGLKGTMSEAELHLLAGRLHGAKQAAAGRGALRFPLPVGYVYDEARATRLDPDEEIQTAVRDGWKRVHSEPKRARNWKRRTQPRGACRYRASPRPYPTGGGWRRRRAHGVPRQHSTLPLPGTQGVHGPASRRFGVVRAHLDATGVDALVAEHLARRANHNHTLWALIK